MSSTNWRQKMADDKRRDSEERYLTEHQATLARLREQGKERPEHPLNDKIVTPKAGKYADQKPDGSGLRYSAGARLIVTMVRDGRAIVTGNHGHAVIAVEDLSAWPTAA